MALTPEELAAELEKRLIQPRQTEYKSAAGHRRSENQDLDQLYAVYKELKAVATPRPTFRRASHSRGFRK